METELTGSRRRVKIIELLQASHTPLSGSALGKATGVSRQVVVQDIALLRREGHSILSTPRGYQMDCSTHVTRLVKVCHTDAETEQELNTIVDLGGSVEDVIVNHRAYGKISAPLQIKSRRDVQNLRAQLKSGKSSLLMNLTSGYHFHHISAESEEILDEIESKLEKMGFLAEFLPYEGRDM